MRQTASRIREMKEAAAEALKRIPVLGRALSNAAAIGSKGWGGLKKLISGVGSGLKTLASGAIRKASGAFSALIQKFSSGIPLMKRFSSANKSVSSGLGGGLKNILKYTLGIRSLFVLVNKLRSALVDGFKNLSQYSGETNNSLSMLMSSLTQLKNAFAAAFAPILNVSRTDFKFNHSEDHFGSQYIWTADQCLNRQDDLHQGKEGTAGLCQEPEQQCGIRDQCQESK